MTSFGRDSRYQALIVSRAEVSPNQFDRYGLRDSVARWELSPLEISSLFDRGACDAGRLRLQAGGFQPTCRVARDLGGFHPPYLRSVKADDAV